MAIPSFPGVFIQEVASGIRTITGVATAVAAFLGRTRMGPVNEPIAISNFGEFERQFGAMERTSSVGYAVRDFFLNGGGQAVIVRLFHDIDVQATADAATALITFTGTGGTPPTLDLKAASPGVWGQSITVVPAIIDDPDVLEQVGISLGLPEANWNSIFSLEISFGGTTEQIRNVTLIESPRRFDRVLAAESRFVRAVDAPDPADPTDATFLVVPGTPPVPLVPTVTGGADSANLDDADYTTSEANKTGIFALEKTDLFNILCIPPDQRVANGWNSTTNAVYGAALTYCQKRRAMLVVDPPPTSPSTPPGAQVIAFLNQLAVDGLAGEQARNGVFYFPRVVEADPLGGGALGVFVPCGIVAGVMARTDGTLGVWKAPAGIDAGILGIRGLDVNLTDFENGQFNPLGGNALRTFPVVGSVVWGARTLRGSDAVADDYKYLPVRRTALFIEESLFRGTKFAVFEPNDEPLWSQLRLNIGAFMNNLFRQGAFQGQTAREAYFVKCDKETTTQNDINLGVVNILVGFAPLKPAEFVVIKLQQIAGQIAT